MILQYKNIQLNFEYFSDFDTGKNTILFLHGFTGSANDWKDVSNKLDNRFNKIALDLIGHGKSSSPADIKLYMIDSIIEQIEQIINHLRLTDIILCGYSMGGRAALNFALEKPNLVKGLILESSSTGIKNDSEREERKKNDDELASYLENNSIEDFVKKWLDQEIFGTLKRFSNEKMKLIKEEKMKNTRTGLANSLRGFGTGVMPYLGDKLYNLNLPVRLISGQLDSKFTRINADMEKLFPKAKHIVIINSGHNIHLEELERFVKVVNRFLRSF
jgi:2-succinyl-6-hydroxy-2,4-cyclohexadiene-1-carboxylate synthase